MSRNRTPQGQQHEGPAPEAVDFESAVEQIEKIIERIESGEIGLEDSIAQYERGVGLIRRCRQVLDRAEQRVEELTSAMQEDAARESSAHGKTGGGAVAPDEPAGEGEDQEPPF